MGHWMSDRKNIHELGHESLVVKTLVVAVLFFAKTIEKHSFVSFFAVLCCLSTACCCHD